MATHANLKLFDEADAAAGTTVIVEHNHRRKKWSMRLNNAVYLDLQWSATPIAEKELFVVSVGSSVTFNDGSTIVNHPAGHTTPLDHLKVRAGGGWWCSLLCGCCCRCC